MGSDTTGAIIHKSRKTNSLHGGTVASACLRSFNEKTEMGIHATKPVKFKFFYYYYLICCSYVQSACKIFKAAEECRLDRDEEKSYVLYMKYLTVYDIIKKRPDFKQQSV